MAERTRLHRRVGAALGVLGGAALNRWPALRRMWPTTVRARATVGASVVVAAALAVASFALLGLLEANLLRNAENDARRQAETVAQLAATGKLGRARLPARGVEFVQVVSADGRILFASPNLPGVPGPSAGRPRRAGDPLPHLERPPARRRAPSAGRPGHHEHPGRPGHRLCRCLAAGGGRGRRHHHRRPRHRHAGCCWPPSRW
ncbi:hypothetical protein [Streptomyces sp. NBC_01294]|uniref:hypothetical protein n=1 Tax=Streptomyces sp. NBC_01294 TaxID=2903815 RepID=UPI002DD977E5|nr:hypothetical protein [Streptomyces sp. NBC_01294]